MWFSINELVHLLICLVIKSTSSKTLQYKLDFGTLYSDDCPQMLEIKKFLVSKVVSTQSRKIIPEVVLKAFANLCKFTFTNRIEAARRHFDHDRLDLWDNDTKFCTKTF